MMNSNNPSGQPPVYERIYDLVRQIPEGQVATYGQVAELVGGCTARMIGYAMAALTSASDIPWQRVINSQGKISIRSSGDAGTLQRKILEDEGVLFDTQDRIDLKRFGWLSTEREFNYSMDNLMER